MFRMLNHRRTKGYGTIPFGVITHVNDVAVKNLRQLVELLRDNQEEFITYTVGGLYETIVFRRDEMQGTTEDVMDESGIRYQYSKDLAEVWEKGPQTASARCPSHGERTPIFKFDEALGIGRHRRSPPSLELP